MTPTTATQAGYPSDDDSYTCYNDAYTNNHRSHDTYNHSYTGYHLATPALAAGARSVDIYKGERFSDHAPVTIEYAW